MRGEVVGSRRVRKVWTGNCGLGDVGGVCAATALV